MSIFTFMRSGVYLQTDDRTGRARIFNSTPGGIVIEAARGPVDETPTLITSQNDWYDWYGLPNPKISPAHDAGLAFLEESSILYTKRAVNGALWGGSTLYRDRYSSLAANGNVRFRSIAFPVGMQTGYKGGARDFDLVALGGDLIADNVFSMSITDGVTTTPVGPIAYATSHNSTLAAVAAAITTALASFGTGGLAQVIPEPSGNNYLIAVWAPVDATVSYGTPTVTLGTSQATAAVDGQARVVEIFADNPGAWNQDVGYRLTNVDAGVAQRFRLVFSSAVQTGQTIGMTVNGTTVTVPFDTDSDSTIADLATALQNLPTILSATVEEAPGAVNNDRVINVIAQTAGPGELQFTNAAVTGTGTLPAISVIENLKGIKSSGEMQLLVYERSNVRAAAELHRVSLSRQVNSRGTQTSIDNVVNLAASRSRRIKVVIPDYARDIVMKPSLVDGEWVIDGTNIKWLSGGDDGAACTNGQIASAWDAFIKRDRIAARLLINGGYTNPVVQQKMIEIAENRYDAMAVLDIPKDKTKTQDAYEHRMYTMNIDSSYGALYSPWLTISDERTDEIRDIPPSGHVAGVYAFSERTSTIFHAPAGLVRGKIGGLLGLTEDYNDGDREILEPNGINPIVDFPGVGPAVFGEETMQYRKSILSSVHARRLLNLVQVSYADELKFSNFDPANENLWYRARQQGERLLKPFKDAGGLVGYEVVCDERNNGPEVRDNDGMQVWIYLKITPAAKRILLKAILLPTGAKFSEEIANDTALAA